MIFINETENSAKWIDENYSKLPRPIDDVIAETIKEYYNKYKDAEYFSSREDYLSMIDLVIWMKDYENIQDELL